MNYSKKLIESYALNTGFNKNYIEKVIRLIDVLSFLYNESSFKDKLVLKGGTAINLVYTNLKRLSVDIDLDYFGAIDKETTLKDRLALEEELDKYMIKEGYDISSKSRNSHALFSRIYKFQNAFYGNDTIKLDVNFMDRVHLYPLKDTTINYFDKSVTLKSPSKEELFAMKLNALLDRSKPRDIYDSLYIVDNINSFDKDALRKACVFYMSLNNNFTIDEHSFDKIKAVNKRNILLELMPVLKKGEKFNLLEAQEKLICSLKELLCLSENEKQYLLDFSKGVFSPSLIFDEEVSTKALKHPMALWRIMNINK